MTGSGPSELRQLLSAGDQTSQEQAWEVFVRTYNPLLLSTARKFGGEYDAAMDRYAYVLEQLRSEDFKRLRGYVADGRSKFTTWLVVVARRLCLDYQRKRYGRPRGDTVDEAASDERMTRRRLVDLVAERIDLERIADRSEGNPESRLRGKELRSALEQAIRDLEPSDKLLVQLRFYDEVPVREIAEVMRLPSVFHVYRRLDSVLKSIRRSLEIGGFDDSSA